MSEANQHRFESPTFIVYGEKRTQDFDHTTFICGNRLSFNFIFDNKKWIFGQTEYELHNHNISGVKQHRI